MARFRKATQVDVYIDGAPEPLFKALRAKRTTGGRELDRAEIEYDLAAADERLVDWDFYRTSTEVEIVAAIPGAGDVVLHWGKLSIDAPAIGKRSERLTLVSRAEPFHFGNPVAGQWQTNPLTGELQLCPIDLVFNPEIDGRCQPNMHPDAFPYQGLSTFVFLDPESVRTSTAKEFFGVDATEPPVVAPGAAAESGGADYWTLATAVRYLCTTLGADQTNFELPSVDDLDLFDVSADLLRDVRIRRGLFLPQALEELLTPFGYGFYVNYLGVGERKLAFFARGQSQYQDTAVLNAPGGVIDGDNAPQIELDYNRGNARNSLTVQGDFIHYESTFTLVRAWPENLDSLNPTTDLAKDSDNFQNNPAIRDVWRKWVLNESGDYTELRPEISQAFDFGDDAPDEAYSGGAAFGTQVPRRRKFLPCITLGDDLAPIGDVQGCVVEWSVDAGVTWLPLEQLDNHTCHLLERECGVIFDAQLVPGQLYDAGVSARVRITATVRLDDRVVGQASSQDGPQEDVAPAILDAAARFHFRLLGPNSKFAAEVNSGVLQADQVDDSQAINDYAQHLLNAWNMADLSGSITIEGLDGVQYGLADILYKIEGREISLNAVAPGGAEVRNPQIVGIEYSLRAGGQFRVLKLETYREEAIL